MDYIAKTEMIIRESKLLHVKSQRERKNTHMRIHTQTHTQMNLSLDVK